MPTIKANFVVTGSVARWWVAIEPVNVEFEKPGSPYSSDLLQGVPHAVVYYAQGAKGQTFKLTGKSGSSDLFDSIEREINSKGFIYGHKGFTP
jgi:hypothetical protein